MNGPISVHTITADTKFPEPLRLDVTITLPLEIYDLDYDLSRLGEYLYWHFHDYDEGRFPLDTEMFVHAMNMCLQNAIHSCVGDIEYEKYRGQMVVTSPGSKTSKGVLTAEAILKKMRAYMNRDGMKFAVKPSEPRK